MQKIVGNLVGGNAIEQKYAYQIAQLAGNSKIDDANQ